MLGRLIAEFVKGVLIVDRDRRCSALVFGIDDRQRRRSASCCSSLLTALWAVVFVGFMQLIALKTRSAAATNSGGLIFFPLLFLTPNFVPRDLLTRPMEIAATLNPVTYVMEALRSLILRGPRLGRRSWPGFAVVASLGALMLALNVRMINTTTERRAARWTNRRASDGRAPRTVVCRAVQL